MKLAYTDILQISFDKNALATMYPYDNMLARKIKYFFNFMVSPEEKATLISWLFGKLVENEDEFAKQLYMNPDDLRELQAHNMLGTHASSHKPLGSLDRNEMACDIRNSLDFLQQVTRMRPPSISYPYGRGKAVSEEVAAVSQELGLRFGITTYKGVNTEVDLKKRRLLLKRIATNDAPGGSSYKKGSGL